MDSIQVGDYLAPEGWDGLGGLLQAGHDAVGESYPGSSFTVETMGTHRTYPVNLTITGRSLTYRKFSKPAKRVKIEWIHDGEPNTTSRGFIVFNH